MTAPWSDRVPCPLARLDAAAGLGPGAGAGGKAGAEAGVGAVDATGARRHLLRSIGALALSFAASRSIAQAPTAAPLNIALAPFLSPAALLATFAPLRRHLERHLARPVEMVTARDFRVLMEATRRGEHDVVQLPAHLARLAMLDWGWRMLVAPTATVTVVVCVKASGPVRTAADLRGRRVGMLDALSLTATVGRHWLGRQGLDGASTVVAMASVNTALFALDRDEVAAIVCADTQLNSLPESTPRGERVLASIGDIPGPMYVARPGLPAAELDAVRAALESFQHDPARPPTAANSPLRPLSEQRLARLDGYVAVARQALASGR